MEALVAGGVGLEFVSWVELGFPDHVADAVADLEEELDDVVGEAQRVEGEGADLGDVGAEAAVDAAAFDAEDDAEVDGNPFDFGGGAAVGAPAVAGVVAADLVEELGGVFLVAVAIGADVGGASADGDTAVDGAGRVVAVVGGGRVGTRVGGGFAG